MTSEFTLGLITALFTKHFICDFPFQSAYQALSKSTYGHLGGLQHAFIHGIGTLVVLLFFIESRSIAVLLTFLDALIHYHVDWGRLEINRLFLLSVDHKYHKWLIGVDQYLHALTYIFIAWLVV